LPSEGKGRTFESYRVRQSFQWVSWKFLASFTGKNSLKTRKIGKAIILPLHSQFCSLWLLRSTLDKAFRLPLKASR